MELRDRDSQAPKTQQDLLEGAIPQVAGAPGTGTSGSQGSGVSQVTSISTQGTGTIQVPGAGTQVTGHGTHGSVGSSTGVQVAGVGTSLHGIGVGPSCGPSSVRGISHSEE